jgi:hypothetical protein
MHTVLDVNLDSRVSAERMKRYQGAPEVKLSDLKGISACAERALVGKHLLDLLGVKAAYMGGVASHYEAEGMVADLTDHSFLVLQQGEQSLVFDIARPHASGWPRLVIMDHPMTVHTFVGENDLLLSGLSPFSRSDRKELFGVGDPNVEGIPRVLGQ